MSSAVRSISAELDAQLARDREFLPEASARFARLSAGEPYRQRCSAIHERLLATAADPSGEHAYERASELAHDLATMARSLGQNGGALIARGRLARVQRTVAVIGFHLAVLDIREHARAHHSALAELFAALEVDYETLDRAERTALLGSELASRRPFAPPAGAASDDARSLMDGLRKAMDASGDEIVQSYIVSMTKGCRRRTRARCARPRCRARRYPRRGRAHRLRTALRDHRRSARDRIHSARAARDPVLPSPRRAPWRRPGSHGGVLRFKQGRRNNDVAVGDPQGAPRSGGDFS